MKKEETDSAKLSLLELFISNGNTKQLLEKTQKILKNPLFVCYANLEVLSYSKSYKIKDSSWEEMLGDEPYNFFKFIRDIGVLEKTYRNSPVLINHPKLEHRWISGKIENNGKLLGNVLLLEYNKRFQDGDYELVRLFCDIMANCMISKTSMGKMKAPRRELLLENVFEGKNLNDEVIREELNHIQWNKKVRYYVMVIKENNINYSNLYPIKDKLEQIDPGAIGTIRENSIVLLLSRIPRQIDPIHEEWIEEFVKDYKMKAGLSRVFHQIKDAKEYYLQAKDALALGNRLGESGCLYHYGRFALENMFEITAQTHFLSRFYDERLLKIIEYDEIYDTNYLRDLYVYILTGININESAKLLEIHRNTVSYRISRIEELLNIKITEPEIVFSLNFSLRLLRFNEGENFYNRFNIPRW